MRISDSQRTAFVKLRDNFVPAAFYDLSDRLGTKAETKEDARQFEIFKVTLSAPIWAAPLSRNFNVTLSDKPLEVGDLPGEVLRADYWSGAESTNG